MVSKGIERQGGHQGLQIRVMPTDERKLARGAVHHDIRNPWSPPHLPSGDKDLGGEVRVGGKVKGGDVALGSQLSLSRTRS